MLSECEDLVGFCESFSLGVFYFSKLGNTILWGDEKKQNKTLFL